MSDNEMVKVELSAESRLKLAGQLNVRMEKLGFGTDNYKELGLGFDLPEGWPIDINAQPTLPQLAVLAVKLKMRLVIDELNLVPMQG